MAAFDQHLHGAVGKFQQLQNGADGAEREQIFLVGIVLRRVLLGQQQNLLVVLHDVFERAHGFLATDEQRHDHMGKYNDIAQGKDWIKRAAG